MARSMNQQTTYRPRLHFWIGVLCLWPAVFVPAAYAEVNADDPVVADVVRMLEAGLEPRVIRSWLDHGRSQPARLSANDMIALAAANAPAELVEDLLQRSTGTHGAAEATAGKPPATNATMNEVPPRTAIQSGADDCCLVEFSVEYRAPEQDAAEENDAPRGDLYLYVDGRFLGRVAPRAEIAATGPLTFEHRIAPGSHTIRLARELHLRSKNRNAGGARDHLTIVSPSSIQFEVQPDARWSMDIRWAQGVFSTKLPLRWRWSRDGKPVAGEEHAGAYQEDWPFLCDDVEISQNSGAISEWRATDRSRDCVTWASLWPQGIDTSREQILAEFEAAGFRPGTVTLE